MRIVVDTSIAFSAILNTNSQIARILLQPKTRFNFYSTERLSNEIEEHRAKIKKLIDCSDFKLNRMISIVTGKIRFINVTLIPLGIFQKAENLTKDIDIDDTEFVALTEHIKGKLWSGDKELKSGLEKMKWNKFITTEKLYNKIISVR